MGSWRWARCAPAAPLTVLALVGFVVVSIRREQPRRGASLAYVHIRYPDLSGAGVILRADVDALYFFVVAVSAFFALVVAVLVIVFGVKFRRKQPARSAPASRATWRWSCCGA